MGSKDTLDDLKLYISLKIIKLSVKLQLTELSYITFKKLAKNPKEEDPLKQKRALFGKMNK